MLQITDYCPQGVAVMHDEFRGWGFSGIGRFLGVGAAVVDGTGMFDRGGEVEEGSHYVVLRLKRWDLCLFKPGAASTGLKSTTTSKQRQHHVA